MVFFLISAYSILIFEYSNHKHFPFIIITYFEFLVIMRYVTSVMVHNPGALSQR